MRSLQFVITKALHSVKNTCTRDDKIMILICFLKKRNVVKSVIKKY